MTAGESMRKSLWACGLLWIALPAILSAQYYPAPRRIVIPGTPKPDVYKDIAGTFHGKLKDLTNKEITIQTEDDQIVSIHRSRKTKFLKGTQTIKPTDIDLESMVTVEASQDPADTSLTAVSVSVDTPKKQGDSDKLK
jgi:hypothetical protein